MIAAPELRANKRAPGSAGAGRLRCGWRALAGSWGAAAALHAALLATAAFLTSMIVRHRAADPELPPVRLALGGTGAAGKPGLPGSREPVASHRPSVPDLPPGEIETGEPPVVPGTEDLRLGPPPSSGGTVREDLMAGHIPEHSGRGRPGDPRGVRAGHGIPVADGAPGSGAGDPAAEGASSTPGSSTGGDSGTGGEGGDGWARRQGGRLPSYPAAARRRGIEGTATLSLDVAADGTVASVRLEKSSGHRLLDDAATEAAWTWTFLPALRDGRAEPSRVTMPVTFRLTD